MTLGISDAYYCAECTRLEKDRDGCPKIVNLGASRTDLFYERRRLGKLPTVHCVWHANSAYIRFQERLAYMYSSTNNFFYSNTCNIDRYMSVIVQACVGRWSAVNGVGNSRWTAVRAVQVRKGPVGWLLEVPDTCTEGYTLEQLHVNLIGDGRWL
jgi:hypothetical protein